MKAAKTGGRMLFGALAVLVLVAAAGPTVAWAVGPELKVELSHTPTSIPRNQEFLTYTVKARNGAQSNPEVGDTLACNGVPAEWGGSVAWGGAPTDRLSFAYQWLRNGLPIAGAGGSIPLAGSRPTYLVASADEGAEIQCEIRATVTADESPEKDMTFVAYSIPGQVVLPLPSPEAPLAPKGGGEVPNVTGNRVVGEQLHCTAPEEWSGSPTWSFIWLRNGIEVGTGPDYLLTAADEHTEIQCVAKATTGAGVNSNGAVAVASRWRADIGSYPSGIATSPFLQPTTNNYPRVELPNATSGPVNLEVSLPMGGPETRVVGVTTQAAAGAASWSCTAREPQGGLPAKVLCTTAESVAPQQALRNVVIKAALGPQAPDSATATARLSGGGSSPEVVEDTMLFAPATPFGVTSLETKVAEYLGNSYTQAGGHPFSAAASFNLSHRRGAENQIVQVEFLKDVVTDLPAGFVGNPEALPQGGKCSGTAAVIDDAYAAPACPRASIVGFATVELALSSELNNTETNFPIYEIEPERGKPAQFAFYLNTQKTIVTLAPELRPSENYAIRLVAPPLPKNPALLGVSATLCGFGTNVQLPTKGYHGAAPEATGCKPPEQAGAEPANSEPFLTNQTECAANPPVTKVAVDSWEHPGSRTSDGSPNYSDPNWRQAEYAAPNVTGCESVPFQPKVALEPTSHQADSPTGLNVSIEVPAAGLETPGGISQAALKNAVVTLPKGMAVNPSSADGLGACNAAQISLGTNDPVQCPASSKIGTAEVVTPLLDRPLTGAVYLAQQGNNPFHSLLALYLVVESGERGILVKIPGRVTPQADGQLVAEFDENPQVPFSSLQLHFNSGNRAPLLNPPVCGNYSITSDLTPWSAPSQILSIASGFQITEGPNGGACPSGATTAALNAGLTNPIAGTTSPFILNLSRPDGSGRIDTLNVKMPPGLTAYLRGIPYCSDAALAGISSAEGTGAAEIASPSCPGASLVGSVSVGAGGGPNPYYVNTGRAYLAGPYKGAPLSLAIVTPAVAGPFDLGNVVVRTALYVDPETAQITAKSDPIPTILHGIPIDVRDIRVSINRPAFTLAPTSCEVSSVGAEVSGPAGGVALSNRFQVGGCDHLPFKPKLKIQLKGATGRTGLPALKAVLTAAPGEAGIGRAQVNLPHGEFLEQNNLNKTCTRPVLLEGKCPKSTIYGRAKAWTPLLEKPLQGPVYLVGGYGYKLPALVAELNGQIRVVLKGKVDSGPNGGIRNTFEAVPDAPVSRFALEMKGGKKYGLLINSENLCKAKKADRRAVVRFTGQNGKVEQFKPVVANQCGKGKKHKKKHSGHHRDHRTAKKP
jgi:hypothetical protein